MKTKILALLSIAFILCACSSPENPESRIPMMMINIEGVVTDLNTDKPIEGAQVTVFTFEWGETYKEICSAKTNQEGYYSIHQSHKCVYKLGAIKAEKGGYKTFYYYTSDDHSPDCTEELQIFNFQLESESGGLR